MMASPAGTTGAAVSSSSSSSSSPSPSSSSVVDDQSWVMIDDDTSDDSLIASIAALPSPPTSSPATSTIIITPPQSVASNVITTDHATDADADSSSQSSSASTTGAVRPPLVDDCPSASPSCSPSCRPLAVTGAALVSGGGDGDGGEVDARSLRESSSLERIAELERMLAHQQSINKQLVHDNKQLSGEVLVLESRVATAEAAVATSSSSVPVPVPVPVRVGDASGSAEAEPVDDEEEAADPRAIEIMALKLQHQIDQDRIHALQSLIHSIEEGRVARGGVAHSRRALTRMLHATRRSGYESAVSSRASQRGLKGAPVTAHAAASHANNRFHFSPRGSNHRSSSTR